MDARLKPNFWMSSLPSKWDDFLAGVAGVDPNIMREQCPPQDWSNIRASAGLSVIGFMVEAVTLSGAALRLFGDGTIERSILCAAGGVAISAVILCLDSYTILRSLHHERGLESLRVGGLKVKVPIGQRILRAMSIVTRLGTAVILAQISSVAVIMPLLGQDTNTEIRTTWERKNTALIERATSSVDDAISAVADDVAKQKALVTTDLERRTELSEVIADPIAADPAFQKAISDEDAATALEKSTNDALLAGQIWSADELSGQPGGQHSSKAGSGPVFRAAQAKVAALSAQKDAATAAVAASHSRVEGARAEAVASAASRAAAAQQQFASVDAATKADQSTLAGFEQHLESLQGTRGADIQSAMSVAPDYVAPNYGVIGQFESIERLAEASVGSKILILLLELGALAVEGGLLAARLFSFIPSTYDSIVAREAYLNSIRQVDAIKEALAQREAKSSRAEPEPPGDEGVEPRTPSVPKPANDWFGEPDGTPRRNPVGRPPNKPR